MDAEAKKCPHCGSVLLNWMPPEDSSWGLHPQKVCFNDECSYYVKGWKHMKERFQQRASYRYRFNPQNGAEGPLPVWSPDAHRDRIVEEEDTQ